MLKTFNNKNHSVASQLTIWLFISIFAASSISALFFSLIMYKNISKDINDEGNDLIEYFAGVIEIPLWNFEEDSLNLIVKTLSKNEVVESIIVSDENGNILFSNDKTRNKDRIKKTRSIYHNNEHIGDIYIYLSQHIYFEKLREVLLTSVLLLLTSLIPAIILINFLIKIFLREPFRQLESLASSYSEGNFNIDTGNVHISEFIPFFNIIEKMGKRITLQLDTLKKTTYFLETLKNTAPDSILILSEEGLITEINNTMHMNYGYSINELNGKLLNFIGYEKNYDSYVNFNINQALIEKERSFQWTVKSKEGTAIPVVARLKKMIINDEIYIISFLTDKREIIKAESEKKKSEEKYKWLVENLSDEYFFYSYNKENVFSYISPSIENILGYSVEDYKQNFRNYRTENIINKDADMSRNLLLTGKKRKASFDMELKDINGNSHIFEITESPVYDSEDKIIYLEGIAHDVTDRRTIQEKTRVSQKMEAIGNLAGGIAHDFNNILGAMLGYTELAISETDEKSPEGIYLAEIFKASKRASQLVKQILIFSRQSKNERINLDLDVLIKEVITLLKITIPVNVKLNYILKENPGPVFADTVQIHQVLINLLTNAYQAINDEKGVIDITLDSKHISESSSSLTGLMINPGNYAIISVRDTGHGIEKEIIDRIFEPYYTTKKHGQGTGLGLSVVHGIIKNHQGKIELESTIGKGTVFNVYIPVSDKYTVSKNESGVISVQQGKAKVLFVDDNIEFLNVTEKMLINLGCEVTKTDSPLKAEEILRESPDNFDLVISDYSMPEINGIDFSKNIYKTKSSLPVIICTGTIIDLKNENIDDTAIKLFLEKPLTLNDLSEAIKYCIE